ncbi:sensor histidine kinase [Bordetella ansorpii]|uniref:histidine kinase n=1 Tax=Bordetella ansorpii TaxID=288768 RepID=A0A157SW65_9BORD|nr:HAMP domain-containing sensor histidine kinase [Bordetella ansorpii]SAI74708.1 sensor histidine kinase [Bordetella ansorpii]
MSWSIVAAGLRRGFLQPASSGTWRAFWRGDRARVVAMGANGEIAPLYNSHFRQASCVAFIFLLVTLGSIAWGQNLLEQVMVRHVKDMISAEIRARQGLGDRDGTQQLARQLGQSEATPRRERAAAVQAADGTLIYGMPELLSPDMCAPGAHACSGWLRASLDSDQGMREWLGYAYALPQGGRYVVAYDILPMLNRIYPVPLVVGLSVFTALLMSLGVGMYSSFDATKRINRIRQAMARFARGETDSRVGVLGRHDEFDQLGKDVNTALERIDFLMEEVRNAANHIAHELRTPLTRLQQRLSNVAEAAQDNTATSDEVALAEEEIRHIQYLFRTVMRISEIETGRCHHESTPIDARTMLADLNDYYGVLADERRLTMNLRIEEPLQLVGDRPMLFQAMVNLVENAIKYAPEGSAITLLARERAGAVELGVADEGPGIDTNQRGQAVQRFRRLARDRAIAGHGLGLPLVQAVAGLHGGSLVLADNDLPRLQEADPPRTRGLLALLRLPLAPAAH